MWGDVGRLGEIKHLVCNGCELLVDECTQLANGQMHLPRVTTGSVVRGGHATCRRGRDHHHGEDTSARGGEEGSFWKWISTYSSCMRIWVIIILILDISTWCTHGFAGQTLPSEACTCAVESAGSV